MRNDNNIKLYYFPAILIHKILLGTFSLIKPEELLSFDIKKFIEIKNRVFTFLCCMKVVSKKINIKTDINKILNRAWDNKILWEACQNEKNTQVYLEKIIPILNTHHVFQKNINEKNIKEIVKEIFINHFKTKIYLFPKPLLNKILFNVITDSKKLLYLIKGDFDKNKIVNFLCCMKSVCNKINVKTNVNQIISSLNEKELLKVCNNDKEIKNYWQKTLSHLEKIIFHTNEIYHIFDTDDTPNTKNLGINEKNIKLFTSKMLVPQINKNDLNNISLIISELNEIKQKLKSIKKPRVGAIIVGSGSLLAFLFLIFLILVLIGLGTQKFRFKDISDIFLLVGMIVGILLGAGIIAVGSYSLYKNNKYIIPFNKEKILDKQVKLVEELIMLYNLFADLTNQPLLSHSKELKELLVNEMTKRVFSFSRNRCDKQIDRIINFLNLLSTEIEKITNNSICRPYSERFIFYHLSQIGKELLESKKSSENTAQNNHQINETTPLLESDVTPCYEQSRDLKEIKITTNFFEVTSKDNNSSNNDNIYNSDSDTDDDIPLSSSIN